MNDQLVQAPITIMQAVVLGVVQGLTEYLPISSSAHLRVVPALLHWPYQGVAYDAVIQLGSVLAVLTYFAKDIWKITTGALKGVEQDVRMVGAIVVGTIPVCVLGLLLKHIIEQENSPMRSMMVIGAASIFMGLLLIVAEKIGKHRRTIDSVRGKDGLLVGLGQAMALIPGCSRSGSTLTVAMLLDFNRADAARFSFLLGIPAIVISGGYELFKMIKDHALEGAAMSDLLVGLVASTIVSYMAIAWFLKYLQQHSTWVFVWYRLIFGAAVLVLTAVHLISN
ncbi:MAG TPA: undecaprenyl-diphosphate phosphatase [Trichormus sp.]